MSKKSKKILAYLMFVAALCGTPAVSEARGGSGGQVATEKASVARRENSDQGFSYRILKNYGPEILKWLFLGGAGYGTAKVSDIKVLARYVSGIENADEKKLKEFKKKLEEEEQKFGIEVAKFKKEKNSFEQDREKAIKDNEKLFGDKAVLEVKVNNFNAKIDENKKEIDKLKNFNQALVQELSSEKAYNKQLNGIIGKNDENLSNFIGSKMSDELDLFVDDSWKQHSYTAGGNLQVNATPYSSNQGDVIVTYAKYSSQGVRLGDSRRLNLKADKFFDALAKEAGGGGLANISLKDIGLEYFGVPYLARCSYSVDDSFLVFYFPVANAQEINVENNNNENNENENENDNINENENIENNENVNNEDENLNNKDNN